MTKRMLIDATHPEETRVVVADDSRVIDFDVEIASKRPLKGNIYLAKVTRVEPSLQAAFVDYGGQRHGFLPFSEIHPDYYQIPQADRDELERLERELEARAAAEAEPGEEDGNGATVTHDAEEETADVLDEIARRRARLLRSYKIQEVIKRRQIMLVQVVKEERGTKGAALTTYLSLAGRYCVLMPNTPRGGGISRKITNPADRKRLKKIAQELDVPPGMGLIIRTAGQERSKAEIRRDFDYLLRLWNDIRETTLKSIAPCLIHEEGDLIKRALRDLYTRDIEEVLVEGEEAYRAAKRVMQIMTPSRARQVKLYSDEVPLFVRFGIEDQLDAMMSPVVELPSGGSIVIHTTEALTAIDVNSGRSTRERHIDETALKTNLEAADEIARQLRLRDLAGLIVIDFIDMSDHRHQRQVERRLREALKADRARLQVGRISNFGLLELSRQRLRPSLLELSSRTCPTCAGTGLVRSTESIALQALRRIQEEGIKNEAQSLRLTVPVGVALYLLNRKRDALTRLEQRYGLRVEVVIDDHMAPHAMTLEIVEKREAPPPEVAEEPARPVRAEAPVAKAEEEAGEETGRRRRRRRRRRRPAEATVESVAAGAAAAPATGQAAVAGEADAAATAVAEEVMAVAETAAGEASDKAGPSRRRRRRRRRPAEPSVEAAREDVPASEATAGAPIVIELPLPETSSAPSAELLFEMTAEAEAHAEAQAPAAAEASAGGEGSAVVEAAPSALAEAEAEAGGVEATPAEEVAPVAGEVQSERPFEAEAAETGEAVAEAQPHGEQTAAAAFELAASEPLSPPSPPAAAAMAGPAEPAPAAAREVEPAIAGAGEGNEQQRRGPERKRTGWWARWLT
jgi:ribonuclease E